MKPILLATQSKYKIALFEKLGLDFETAAPNVDERAVTNPSPSKLALQLAESKARALESDYPNHLIIGADQVLALDNHIFNKPGTTEKAVAQLTMLTGKTHELHTAAYILSGDSGKACLTTSRITFHPGLHPAFLKQLVEEDQTTDCVGSYKFESKGIMLMKKVETEDGNAIVGLPLLALIRELQHFGYFPNRFNT